MSGLVKDIQLSLMIGPVFATPVSHDVLDALQSVTVTTSRDKTSFNLTFMLANDSPLQTMFLLTSGSPIPLVRVVLVATVRGVPQVLCDGVMTQHQIQPAKAGFSTLSIMGDDLSRVMDYIDFSGIPYPCMPPEARVALIVAKYAMFGIVPMVIPSIMIADIPLPIDKIPSQKGKDLAYVRSLADDVGYVFYVEGGPTPGMSVAYWGPEIRFGVPQPALNVDMDGFSNVDSLTFSYQPDKAGIPVVFIQDEITKAPIPIPIPPITPISPPLGAIPPIPVKVDFMPETVKYGPLQAVAVGLAKAARDADVVTGTGSLDVIRYGQLLKARQLVGVRGAGPAFDGLHYVTQVTHKIKRGEYKQDFSLVRNGLISTLPQVPV